MKTFCHVENTAVLLQGVVVRGPKEVARVVPCDWLTSLIPSPR